MDYELGEAGKLPQGSKHSNVRGPKRARGSLFDIYFECDIKVNICRVRQSKQADSSLGLNRIISTFSDILQVKRFI